VEGSVLFLVHAVIVCLCLAMGLEDSGKSAGSLISSIACRYSGGVDDVVSPMVLGGMPRKVP
jgi:hypothetical protein